MNDNKRNIENNQEYIEDIELIADESETTINLNNVEDELNYKASKLNIENNTIEHLEEPTIQITTKIPIQVEAEVSHQEEQPIKLTEPKENNEEKTKYVDYKLRLATHIGLFVTFFILTIILLQNAFNLSSTTKINYKEDSKLDYKVYLKTNEFYEEEYLGKNKVYVSSLIDKVAIDFIYNFNIEKESNIQFNYDVIGKLTINDSTSGKNYFEKEYVLLDKKTETINDSNNYKLSEEVEIDYDYYNKLASNFKQQFGVETTSDLTVYLRVNKQNNIDNKYMPVSDSTMYVKIPLSQKSINIELNYQDINNSSYIVKNNTNVIDNIVFAIAAVTSLIIVIIMTIKLIRLLGMIKPKKSNYDKYVEKILNEYDRLIVENNTGPDLVKNNIIKISKFEELLDARENFKLPIMYYVVAKHTKCYFYIKHEDDIYLLTVKAVDLEENKK